MSLEDMIDVYCRNSRLRNCMLTAHLETKKAQDALKNVLRVCGIPEKPLENTTEVVLEFFESKVCQLAEKDVHRSYRCDRKIPRSMPRPIIVEFASSDIRNQVLDQNLQLKEKGCGMFPELCRERNKVRLEAMRYFGGKNVHNVKGSIYVILPGRFVKEFSTSIELSAFQRGMPCP